MDSRGRHLAKTVTWRFIGTLDTMLLAWLISGSPLTGIKVGAAEIVTKMVLYYFHERIWYKINFGLGHDKERKRRKKGMPEGATNIEAHDFQIDSEKRKHLLKQRPVLIWFTGLSGSGKSTMANLLESRLYEMGFKTYILDGDNVRGGLCKDLGFEEKDRVENIRRIGEVSRLLMDAGVIVLSAFVSPFASDRAKVKQLVGEDLFIEVFVDCPLEVCEQRDVKGLYKKARQGKIKNFTGIDSPFEKPEAPDLILKTAEKDKEDLLAELLALVQPKIAIGSNVKI